MTGNGCPTFAFGTVVELPPSAIREGPHAIGPYDQAKRSHADCPETPSANQMSDQLTSRARNRSTGLLWPFHAIHHSSRTTDQHPRHDDVDHMQPRTGQPIRCGNSN